MIHPLILPAPCISESCIKIRTILNVYFHTFLFHTLYILFPLKKISFSMPWVRISEDLKFVVILT